MTKDGEKLKKFLASDDPELVRMGIAMAKGTGVKVTVEDLEHFLKSEDVEIVRNGVLLADEAGIGDEVVAMLWKPLSNPEIEPNRKLSTTQAGNLFGSYSNDMPYLDQFQFLCELGDTRTIEPLIDFVCEENEVTLSQYLGETIGEAAIKPIMKTLEKEEKKGDSTITNYEPCYDMWFMALYAMGDPAVEMLCEAFEKYPLDDIEAERHYMEYLAETGHPQAATALIGFETKYYEELPFIALWCENAEEDMPEYEEAVEFLIENIGEGLKDWTFPSGDKVKEVMIESIKYEYPSLSRNPNHILNLVIDYLEYDEHSMRLLIEVLKDDENNKWIWVALATGSVRLGSNSRRYVDDQVYEEFFRTDKKKILKFLESDDLEMVKTGVSLLKATIEEIEENTEKEEPDASVPDTATEKKPFWKFWS